jgi:hypothetical protein
MRYFFLIPLLFFLGCEEKYKYVTLDSNLTFETLESPQVLKKRFQEYWEYRSQNNFQASYEYELPYLKLLKNKQAYQSFFSNNKYSNISLKKVSSGNNQEADIALLWIKKYNVNGETSQYQDKWVYIDNNWYHYYHASILPPAPRLY